MHQKWPSKPSILSRPSLFILRYLTITCFQTYFWKSNFQGQISAKRPVFQKHPMSACSRKYRRASSNIFGKIFRFHGSRFGRKSKTFFILLICNSYFSKIQKTQETFSFPKNPETPKMILVKSVIWVREARPRTIRVREAT